MQRPPSSSGASILSRISVRELTFFIGSKRSCLDAYVFPMLGWGGEMLPGGLAFFAQYPRPS